MPRKGIKKLLPTKKTIQTAPAVKHIKGLKRPDLWRYTGETVARGVAVGLFVSLLPVPMQMLFAALLSILLNANIPIAVGLTWLSNPLTFVPITYFIYFIGRLVLGEKADAIDIVPFHLHWSRPSIMWTEFITWLSKFGKAFFVGLPLVAIGVSLVGYFGVMAVCHIRSIGKKRKR